MNLDKLQSGPYGYVRKDPLSRFAVNWIWYWRIDGISHNFQLKLKNILKNNKFYK
jgi:hypothetical protein